MARTAPKRLVRIKDAAPYSNCTVKTLRNRIADGTLTAYRTGPKLLLLDLDEIDRKLIQRVAAAVR
jgi:excisionase family DNA binding protein